jgi:flagellar protein FlgJ
MADPVSLGPKGMMALRRMTTPDEQKQKLKEAAERYEQEFLRMMVKQMRGSIQESGLIKTNQAEKIFREELDNQHVETWAKKGGVGFSEVIYQNLLDVYGPALGINSPVAKPKGPIMLDQKSKFEGRVLSSSESSRKTSMQFSLTENPDQVVSLKSPWEGKLLGTKRLDSEENILEIQHDNGLKSQLVFRGEPITGLQGKSVKAGETIGLLSPEAQTFFWNVESGPQSTLE